MDVERFDPDRFRSSPYRGPGPNLVFTGAMDYWPNVDAVTWFADQVLPRLRPRFPGLAFYIVGSRPVEAVRALAKREGVAVTGTVSEIQPWIAHAEVAVAPMRIARGIQNKVLEAMALARPVVVSPMGAEGIHARPGEHFLVARDGASFARAVAHLLRHPDEAESLGLAARERVVSEYSWERTLAPLERWFPGEAEAA